MMPKYFLLLKCEQQYGSIYKKIEFRQKTIDNFNRTDDKMKKIIKDIDETIKSVKKYSDFKLVLKA